MSEVNVYPVSDKVRQAALINDEQYEAMYQASITDPESFWAEQAQRIQWQKPFSRVKDVSLDKSDLHIRWFDDGILNVTESCLDRHLATRGDETAITWEPDSETHDHRNISYSELATEVNRLANGLKSLGVQKGDVVTLYMPMVPEATMAMLACARVGAVHSVVFGGFSPEALAGRIEGADSKVVITADEGLRAGKKVALKRTVLQQPVIKLVFYLLDIQQFVLHW